MPGFKRFQYYSLIVLFALSGGSGALWGSLIYERDLPNAVDSGGTMWVNNTAPVRANVDWAGGPDTSSGYDIIGDTFSFAGGANINSLTVYEISNTPCATSACIGAATPGSEFSSISLFLGPQAGTLNQMATTYSAVQQYYQPGMSYQGPSGDYYAIFALTFNFASQAVAAGQTWAFAVDGIANGNNLLMLSGVNTAAAIQSSTVSNPVIENGGDNQYYYYNLTSQTLTSTNSAAGFPYACNSGGACGGWDKGSDLNVQINGILLPEPGTILLTGLGMLVFASRIRRR